VSTVEVADLVEERGGEAKADGVRVGMGDVAGGATVVVGWPVEVESPRSTVRAGVGSWTVVDGAVASPCETDRRIATKVTSAASRTEPASTIQGSVRRRGSAIDTVVARRRGGDETGIAVPGASCSIGAMGRAGTMGISIVAPKRTEGWLTGVACLAGRSRGPAA
jgi:hypothetical protein